MRLADPLKTAVPAPASSPVSRRVPGFCFAHRRSGGGVWRPALFPRQARRGQRFAFAHFVDPIRLPLPHLHPLETVVARYVISPSWALLAAAPSKAKVWKGLEWQH
jgi:hypothetical protein